MEHKMSEMMEEGMEGEGETPFDGIISRVKQYIKNPKMVTTETLEMLLAELVDLKSVVDEEDMEKPMEKGQSQKEGKMPSLMIALSMGKKNKGMEGDKDE